MSTIVVGVDGSHGSIDALKFAIEEARVRGAEVKAVSAWEVPASAYGMGMMPAPVDPAEFKKIAQETLKKTLAEAGASTASVHVTAILHQGHPADVLVAEARGAGPARGRLARSRRVQGPAARVG